jgi:translation initiation factor 2D
LYTLPELKSLFTSYVNEKGLANANDQSYVNLEADNILSTSLGSRGEEFMKRDEVFRRLLEKMQAWYQVEVEGKDTVLKCAY